MRILDKNTDFYDFYQNIYRDMTYTFDRTASFFITKDWICDDITHKYSMRYGNVPHIGDVFLSLVQVCNDFWLIALEISEIKKNQYSFMLEVSDVSFHLISHFKDYEKERKLISVDIIKKKFLPHYSHAVKVPKTLADCFANADNLIMLVKKDYFESRNHFGPVVKKYPDGSEKEKTIPLLIASGYKDCIDPLDIYNAFEEYFSLEKSSTERTESVGLTDKEKITNHGFDVKSSFRGKI